MSTKITYVLTNPAKMVEPFISEDIKSAKIEYDDRISSPYKLLVTFDKKSIADQSARYDSLGEAKRAYAKIYQNIRWKGVKRPIWEKLDEFATITITVAGKHGAGKSRVAHFINEILKESGFKTEFFGNVYPKQSVELLKKSDNAAFDVIKQKRKIVIKDIET